MNLAQYNIHPINIFENTANDAFYLMPKNAPFEGYGWKVVSAYDDMKEFLAVEQEYLKRKGY